MTAPKLTEAQRYELSRLSSPYTGMSHNLTTMKALARRGFAVSHASNSRKWWEITDAGRAALRGES